NFNFGGRVHTNGNLFLSQGGGATLTLSDKVTAVKEVIRQRLENNVLITTDPTHDGIVNVAKAPGSYIALAANQGSLVDGLGSAQNENAWHTVSLGTSNGYIRNGRTGAKSLNLPALTAGGSNPDLVQRPPVNENTTNSVRYNERLYTKASLRILLSDKTTDISNLPGIDTSKSPISLEDWITAPPAGIVVDPIGGPFAGHPPVARSLGPFTAATTPIVTTAATTTASTTINVNNVPNEFLNPATLTVNNGGSYGKYSCTGRTAVSFLGCTKTSGSTASSNWNLYVSNPVGSNTTAVGNGTFPNTKTPVVKIGGISGTTISLATSPAQYTWGYAAHTFFLNDVNGNFASYPVTCAGYNGTQLTDCTNVPATASGATITTGYLQNRDTGLIGGFIKIEKQDTTGAWTDVTTEILNYGIAGVSLAGQACGGDPTPNAILRLQRLRDNSNNSTAQCPTDKTNSYEYWPNALFDTREALLRDTAPANNKMALGGVMYYIALDVNNVTKWFKGTLAGSTGANSKIDNTGYTVYFSDRRNNRKTDNTEGLGELGFEDIVNPASGSGTPNGTLDQGEDLNANNALDTYGDFPSYQGVSGSVPAGSSPLDAAARAWSTPAKNLMRSEAQTNRAIVFRRALKLINGSNIVGNTVNGLTVVAENPVYIQGDFNANAASDGFDGAHAATSVIADAVTLLSNNWSDNTSFSVPYSVGSRSRVTQTWYRVAIIGGKGPWFPQPNGTATDFGTDGGVHNFLRYLEDGDQPVNYRGSIATFFYNRQGVGTYKCCNTVYGAPTRNYNFDSDFLDPSKLPPNTPVFRDMNAVGFSQELRPGK
ncbi:MAG TPA: hypothetical protein VH497_21180, partial [Vicinamibacterales bacterium]